MSMRMKQKKTGRFLGSLILLLALTGGCTTSDAIVLLPPPEGLPDLANLENHLDYQDPDDGKPDYIPRRAER